jgi:hypothetical protein
MFLMRSLSAQVKANGEIRGLQILDGSAISHFSDDRGMRPDPSGRCLSTGFFGFPRSEFHAPVDDEEADGEFSSDELAYLMPQPSS